ncbi:MAG: 2-keto-4-pentenoate hydratase [Candidatus Kapaibacterium sp.]
MAFVHELAARLQTAQESRTPCDALTSDYPDITVEDAYAVQKINLDRRLSEGGRLVGRKIGLTSFAVQEWLGVSEPDFGGLLNTMAVPNGGIAPTDQLLQPRVEGELAFVLKKSLSGPGITAAEVIAATDFVLPAIEIIDSRIKDWKFKIQDTIADNASSGAFVVGSKPMGLSEINTCTIGLTLRKNGQVVSTGAGVACLGDPVNAVVWLVNKLGELETEVEAGQVILSGALGPVSPVVAGDYVTAQIGRMGEVSVRF